MNGTLHDLNMVLGGVMYQPKPHFVGQDGIIVHAVDSQLAAADSEAIYVSISPIEHLPHIVVNKQQLIVHEDSILGITDVYVEIGNYSAAESQVRSYHSRCCKHFYKFLTEEHWRYKPLQRQLLMLIWSKALQLLRYLLVTLSLVALLVWVWICLSMFSVSSTFLYLSNSMRTAKDSRKTAEALVWVDRVDNLFSRFWRAFQRCKH
jgi:hypothetical protein